MEGVLEAFIALFVIMDPIGSLPIFIGLTKGMPLKEVKKSVDKSVFVAAVLLFAFLFLGRQIFDHFGINLDSFQIAGGIILLILGIFYTLGLVHKIGRMQGNDLSVPLGTPLLTGPGAITTIVILVKEIGTLVTVVASFLTLLATWLILTNASRIYQVLGDHWTNVISRVMGIILAAVAVKFITRGIMSIIASVV